MSSHSGSDEFFVGLKRLEGKYPTYYSSSAKERAEYLAGMTEKGYRFLIEFFKKDFEMPLMVLNKEDWEKRIESFPYGGINSRNNCLNYPADTDHSFLDFVQPLFDSSPKRLQQKLIDMVGDKSPFRKGFNLFFDGKVAHELAHNFLRNSGIHFGLSWFTEFFCDYANYAFLKRYEADYGDLLELQDLPHANYTRSEDFDRLYSDMGWLNTIWFYGRGMLGVLELYKVEGEAFISNVIEAYSPSNDALVMRLGSVSDSLGLWFKEWLVKNP